MKKINNSIMCTFLICLFLGVGSASAADFKIMTEEFPPFNYTDGGKTTGLATDVMMGITKKIGHNSDIEVLPWSRAYALIQKDEGLVLYSMTRTEAREDLFKWVGPVAANKWVLFAKKGSGVSISSLDDAKKVKKIGAYKDDAAESFLKAEGFTNIDSVLKDEQNVPKLMAGRIDLWIVGELQGIHKAKAKGVSADLEKVFDVKDTQLYIAFSKNTSDEDIAKWQKALDEMKADGSYDAILKNYM
ncbi:MAG: polar amino acid transport system substrate-binding protein [Desulforhopalus sp.]|jgi:polar amino acid transport system substrate-binding protein